jgi:hypothetical protein
MTNLQQLIETTENLVNSLDLASQNEKKFCLDICIELEKMSWETFRIMNDLKQIKQYCES